MPGLVGDHEWAGGELARVLVEATEWGDRELISTVLRRAGYRTVGCAGPEGSGHRCTLAAGQGCGAAEQADVVVHALRRSDHRNLEALRALRQRLPGTPVVVEVPRSLVERHPGDYRGCVVVDPPLTGPVLLDAVAEALGADQRSGEVTSEPT